MVYFIHEKNKTWKFKVSETEQVKHILWVEIGGHKEKGKLIFSKYRINKRDILNYNKKDGVQVVLNKTFYEKFELLNRDEF